jgi:hypothetical protein
MNDEHGPLMLDNQLNGDNRPRLYKLNGTLGASFTQDSTAFAGATPGYDDDSVVKVLDLFSNSYTGGPGTLTTSVAESSGPTPGGGGKKAVLFIVQ